MKKGLLEKYRGLPLSVKAGFWFTVCSAVQNGASFLSMPFLVRLLTTEEYGIYSVFRSWINIISIFATLKMCTEVFNNAMYKYPDRRDEYTSAAQSVSITGVTICFIVYLALKDVWNVVFGLPGKYSLLIFIQLFFTESYAVWTAKQRYEYRYMNMVISTVAFSLLYFVMPILAGYMSDGNTRLSAVIYAGVAVQVCFGFGFMVFNFFKGKCFFNREYWKFAIGFNLPLIPHFLSSVILGESDRVMIKNIVGPSEAGIYSFVYTIAIAINIVTEAIRNAIVPIVYDALGKKDFKAVKSAVNILLIAVGGFILMFSAVAPEFIKLFATTEYYGAIKLVPVISLSSFFGFLYTVFSNVEFFFEKNKLVAIASVAGAAANIFLNALLIPIFGYYAAGYTTFLCYGLYALIHYAFMRRVCREKLDGMEVYDEKTVLVISALVILAAFFMLMIYDYWLIRYGALLACLAVIAVKRKKITDLLASIKK